MKTKEQKAEKKVRKFYKWLLNCGNIYLHQHENVCNAFEKVRQNNLK